MSMTEQHFIYVVTFVVTLVGCLIMEATDAEGATTHTFEIINDVSAPLPSASVMGRGLNNRIYVAALTDGWGIDVHYSDDNGTTWDDTTVISPGWKGATYLRLAAVVVTTNNTTVVAFEAQNADNAYNHYAAIMWDATGDLTGRSWEIDTVSGGSTSATRLDCDINDTDHILFTWRFSTTAIYVRLWDFRTDTWNAVENWKTITNAVPMISVNTTGKFHISYRTTQVYYDDLDESIGPITLVTSGQMAMGPTGEAWINIDTPTLDRFIYCIIYNTDIVDIYVQTSHHGGSAKRQITAGGGDLRADYVGLSMDTSNELYVIWYNNDNDIIYRKHEQWDASQGSWDVAATETLKTLTSNDIGYCSGGPNGHYPQSGGHRANVPLTGGYWHNWVWKDEIGATDDYYYEAYWDGSFYWYVYPSPGPGPGPGAGPSGTDFFDWYITDELMEDLWVLFIVTALFVGLATALRRTTDRLSGWQYSQVRWRGHRRPLWRRYRRPQYRRPTRPKYRDLRYK